MIDNQKDQLGATVKLGVSVRLELRMLDPMHALELETLRREIDARIHAQLNDIIYKMRVDATNNPLLIEACAHLGITVAEPGALLTADGRQADLIAPVDETVADNVARFEARPRPPVAPIYGPRVLATDHTHAWTYAGSHHPTKPPIWHMKCACGGWALLGYRDGVLDSRVHDIRDASGKAVPDDSYEWPSVQTPAPAETVSEDVG